MIETKIHKMGPKLGIYFSNEHWSSLKKLKGQYVEIRIIKNGNHATFISKLNNIISLRRATERKLHLRHGNKILVHIKKLDSVKRSSEMFYKNKIDLLYFIPLKTTNCYKIVVGDFFKNNEKWLRCWYSHGRGSGRQLEIRRYMDIDAFGRILGQLQAEGTKNKKSGKLEFCNKVIREHKDFINDLRHLGIREDMFIVHYSYNPNYIDVEEIKKIAKKFTSITNVGVNYITSSAGSKGGHGAKTLVRNFILSDTILNAMDIVRKTLGRNIDDYNMKKLSNSFFRKLLTGDGTLDIRTTGREYNYPTTRVKITDCCKEYLKDYSYLMKQLGFNPKIKYKHIFVRAGCGLNKLLYLYRIKAFRNTPNWNKLLVTIGLYLQGRRHITYYRFIELSNLDEFTSKDYIKKYNCDLRTANDWLNNKEKEGLLIGKRKRPYHVKWSLTPKARKLSTTLQQFKKELKNLTSKRKANGLLELLNTLKTKKNRLLLSRTERLSGQPSLKEG